MMISTVASSVRQNRVTLRKTLISCALLGGVLLLGLVLGPMMEENFRRALLLSRGEFSTFVTRPLSATLLALARKGRRNE